MTNLTTIWKTVGQLTTKPKGILTPTEVKAQQIYVVVGFGVNTPAAYQGGVAYLNIDPGHAFLYTVRNNKVTRFFSFGPLTHGEFLNTPGTPDYGMDYPNQPCDNIQGKCHAFMYRSSLYPQLGYIFLTDQDRSDLKSGLPTNFRSVEIRVIQP